MLLEEQQAEKRKEAATAPSRVSAGASDLSTSPAAEGSATAPDESKVDSNSPTDAAETLPPIYKKLSKRFFMPAEETSAEEQKQPSEVTRPRKTPKLKRRKVKLPDGSEHACLLIPDAMATKHVDLFKDSLEAFQDAISSILFIDRRRVIPYEIRYRDSRLCFAITPRRVEDAESPTDEEPSAPQLMEELGGALEVALHEDETLRELCGGPVTLEWEGPGSKIPSALATRSTGHSRLDLIDTDIRTDSDLDASASPSKTKGSKLTKGQKSRRRSSTKPKRVSFSEEVANELEMLGEAEWADAVRGEVTQAAAADSPKRSAAEKKSDSQTDEFRLFCDSVKAQKPKLFEQLFDYYKGSGYNEAQAEYFAAYYTTLHLQQQTEKAAD